MERSRPDGRGADPPLTVELLADLQAGLLDDDAAARVRSRVRDDPQAAAMLRALNQVRRDVAARRGRRRPTLPRATPISAAQAAGPIAAPLARPHMRPPCVAAASRVAAIGSALRTESPSAPSRRPTTANHITVSTPAPVIPLSDAEILGLLRRPPDFGPLERAHHSARPASLASAIRRPLRCWAHSRSKSTPAPACCW